MRIVAFYTVDTPYEQEAEELKKLLNKYSLKYKFYPVDNKKRWELNCAQKSTVLLQALSEIDDDILYLDVDARPQRQLPIEELPKDRPGFCFAYGPKKHLNSATIWLPNNKISLDVVKAWIKVQEKKPLEWDQRTLEEVIYCFPGKDLRCHWAYINDKWTPLHGEEVVIKQTQASRRLKRVVNK